MHSLRSRYSILCTKLKFNKYFDIQRQKNYSGEKTESYVKIQTCGDIYRKWRDQKLYSKLPQGDLTFKVPFTDTHPNALDYENSVYPTVLALHGAPGSWKDFTYLSTFLHDQGCRVIAPSFPDFNTYKPGIFRHSDVEKTQYVKDFLSAISVSKVDLLVCHSSSVYPGLNLSLDQKPTIKSLALLNPGTFHVRGMRSTRNFDDLEKIVKASENPILLNIMKMIGPFILKKVYKSPIRFENILDPILSATVMIRNVKGSKERFKSVSQKLPIFYAFSENDILIGTKPSYELAELFGASVSDIFIYNNQGHLEQKGIEKPMLKVLAFRQGSHFSFLKYHDLINKEIANFLKTQKIL